MNTAKQLRLAIVLVSISACYNFAEAVIAVWAGTAARSIALFGFGLDSVIEFSASCIVLWRFVREGRGAPSHHVEELEHKAHRFVGATFIMLAIYIFIQSMRSLMFHKIPEESMVGIVLASVSVVLMPLLSWRKLKLAKELSSRALNSEAKETMACAILSFILLFGLVLNAAFNWWWADPAAALLMVPWLVMEGREGLKGQGCC